MNYLLFKGMKHRKATSDCIANSQSSQPSVFNGKLIYHSTQAKNGIPSMEKSDTPQVKKKQTSTNQKRLVALPKAKQPSKGSTSIPRSNSFDKYFLHSSHKGKHSPNAKRYKPCSPKLTQHNQHQHQTSQGNMNHSTNQQSQKMMSFNSPFLKKCIGMTKGRPTEKQSSINKNNSISMEEYFQKTIAPFNGKIHSISLKSHNGILRPERDYTLKIKKTKQDKVTFNSNKNTQRIFLTMQIAPLLTLPSQSHHSRDNPARFKLPLSTRKIEESIRDDTIEEGDLNEKASIERLAVDNFNTKELDEDVDRKRAVYTPFPAKRKFEIENEKDLNQSSERNDAEMLFNTTHTLMTTNMSLNRNSESSHLSLKYQDIIQNNINYSRHNNSKANGAPHTKSINDYDSNKTPQINKFMQFYPQSHLRHMQECIETAHNAIHFKETEECNELSLNRQEPKPEHIHHKDNNRKVIHIIKKAPQLPQAELSKNNTENENTVDIDTECLFEGEEKNEREGKKNIPVFPIKLFNYGYPQKQQRTPLECLFKKKLISPVIMQQLDIKSLSKLCMCNHFLRKKLKKSQYDMIMKTILENDSQSEETRERIRKSVWSYSKLSNELHLLQRTYCDYAYKRSKYDEEIQKDLTRTFPDDASFKYRGRNYTKLYHLLTAYANYNRSIGYAQGLNFLAAHSIFAFDKPEEVFLFVDGLVAKFQLEQLFGVKNHLKEKLEEIGLLLKKCSPYVMSYLEKNGLGHEFFTTNWLLTLFSNSMRRKYLFFVWNFMIVFGKRFFNYFIVAIMIKYSSTIVTYDQSLLSQLMKGLLKSESFESEFDAVVAKTFELMRIYCI